MSERASVADRVEGLVHEPTQVHDGGDRVDLTVAEVYFLERPGRVDFGGGELEEADLCPHPRSLRNDGDDYEWWNLPGGQYVVEFNERLTGGAAMVQTRDAVRARGAFHPTLRVGSLEPVPLSVSGAGIRLKENARVSTLLPAGSP